MQERIEPPGRFLRDTKLRASRRLVPAGSETTTDEVGSSVKRVISSRWWIGLIAAGSALGALPASAETKIGVVDPARLLEDSPQGKAASESMRAEFAPRQRTLQQQEQALKARQEELQRVGATMPDDQRVRAGKAVHEGARDRHACGDE